MAGYKNNSSSNAHERQRTVDQIYLCGKVQSHRLGSTLYLVRRPHFALRMRKSSFFHAVFIRADIAVTLLGSVMSG
jgi:hypothetical protein